LSSARAAAQASKVVTERAIKRSSIVYSSRVEWRRF
jgi:hypothetical protein